MNFIHFLLFNQIQVKAKIHEIVEHEITRKVVKIINYFFMFFSHTRCNKLIWHVLTYCFKITASFYGCIEIRDNL